MLNWTRLGGGCAVANNGIHSLMIGGERGEWHWVAHALPEYRDGKLANDIVSRLASGSERTKTAAMLAAEAWGRQNARA